MTLEDVTAKALRAYRFFPHPESPTLGVLRLDTIDEQHWFLVDRKTLQAFAQAMAKHAEEIEPLA